MGEEESRIRVDGNNDVRFYAPDVRLWAVGGIHFFFLPVQSRYCGDREGVYLRSIVVVDTFFRSQSHRVAGPL